MTSSQDNSNCKIGPPEVSTNKVSLAQLVSIVTLIKEEIFPSNGLDTDSSFTEEQLKNWLVDEKVCTKEAVDYYVYRLENYHEGIGALVPKDSLVNGTERLYRFKPPVEYIQSGGRTFISAATFEGVLFTYAMTTADINSLKHLALAHGQFMTSIEFFDAICAFFQYITKNEDERDVKEVGIIQFRIVNMIKTWLDVVFGDADKDLLQNVKSFIAYLLNLSKPKIGT
eukprot:TRINITY_DN23012_c0_g2_i1.p1 TRINITY_DN23012_c0_g2~~TRINITY_DN23012_c0_g2_i1.p1  ORF type:complete len:246 (+),score=58.15 TRINITY_DN23012_c0_g2_i1:58-738(+)